MSEKPAASVLLPVRDGEDHLDQALRSLSRQTFSRFEVVVADDGSTDGSRSIAEAWGRRDPRFRPLALPRRGIVGALQAALEAACSDLLVRQDADDVSHPARLRRLLGRLEADPDAAVVGSRIRGFPRREISVGMARYEDWQNGLLAHREMYLDRYVESPLAHASAAIRRAPLEAAGGWRDLPWPEDLDLWLRLFRTGARFVKLPETLYFWGERPERATRADVRLSLAAHRRCKIQHLAGEFLGAPPASVTLWSLGRLGEGWERDLRATGYAVDLRRLDPRREIPSPAAAPLLVAYTSPRNRQVARNLLAAMALKEDRDYLCVY